MTPLPLDPPRPRPEEPEHPFQGQLVFQGLPIDVETRAGATRSGVDADGKPWSCILPWHYGEIRGTRAVDGDAVDVFVGPNPHAPWAWVMQTKRPGTKAFDEPKLMLGFDTRDDAVAGFRGAYRGRGFLMGVQRWPMPALVEALRRPDLQAGRLGLQSLHAVMRKANDEQLKLPIVRVKPHTRDGHHVAGYVRGRPPVHFVSGASRVPDLEGLERGHVAIGVTVPELSPAVLDRVFQLAPRTPLFVDSGAFQEVDDQLRVVRPMSDDDWQHILSTYQRIATSSRAWAAFVAPDRVGDQAESLARLRRYRTALLGLARHEYRGSPSRPPLHPEILVPLQLGPLTLDELWAASVAALDFPPRDMTTFPVGYDANTALVPAIAANKGAWPHRAIVDFVEREQPPRLHLLGLGPDTPEATALLDELAFRAPGVEITLDSNAMRSKIGTTGGPGNGPRDITRAQAAAGGDTPAERRARAVQVVLGHPRNIARLERQLADHRNHGYSGTIVDLVEADRARLVAEWEHATGRTWEG